MGTLIDYETFARRRFPDDPDDFIATLRRIGLESEHAQEQRVKAFIETIYEKHE